MILDGAMTPPAATPWGYAPHDGPALWETLDPSFRACGLGREQSPIDLTFGRTADLTRSSSTMGGPASPSRTPGARSR